MYIFIYKISSKSKSPEMFDKETVIIHYPVVKLPDVYN